VTMEAERGWRDPLKCQMCGRETRRVERVRGTVRDPRTGRSEKASAWLCPDCRRALREGRDS